MVPDDSAKPVDGLVDGLTKELHRRVAAAGGDPVRFEETWGELAAAYGASGAADVVRLRAGQILNVEIDQQQAERLAEIASARSGFLLERESAPPGMAPLPYAGQPYRTAEDFELPLHLRVRVEAATDAMRRAFAQAYENPVVAEARLHAMVDVERDWFSVTSEVERNPEFLGRIRADVGDRAKALAPVVGHARGAYMFHLSPTAEDAANLAARQSLAVVSRAAANVERAANTLDRLIDLHGPALNAQLQEQRDRAIRGPSRGPGRGGRGEDDLDSFPDASRVSHDARRSGRGRGDGPDSHLDSPTDRSYSNSPFADVSASPVSEPGPSRFPARDPAVDEAVRAYTILEEARILEARGAALRADRGTAQEVLAALDFDETAHFRTSRDADALARRVYVNQERALERWDALVAAQGGDVERAKALVAARPERLGALHSEPRGGLLAYVPFLRSTEEARKDVPRFLDKAGEQAEAKQALERPLKWDAPSGELVRGRANIRAAANEVEQGATLELDRNNGALLARGGSVETAERNANRAMASLSPEQRSAVAQKLGAAHERPAGEFSEAVSRLAAAPRLAVKAARMLQSAGEGPGGATL